MYYHEKLNEIEEQLSTLDIRNRVVVWPCGKHTIELFAHTGLSNLLDQIEFVDNGRYNQKFMGKEVKKSSCISWEEIDIVIISTFLFQEKIKNELLDIIKFTGRIITFYKDDKREFYNLYNEKYGISWGGEYSTWDKAEELCSDGYQGKCILEACIKSTKQIIATGGSPNYFLLYRLLHNYMKFGNLIIIDFGGGLGIEYFQNRTLMKSSNINYQWCVVEQQHYVEYGNANLKDENIQFFYSLEEIKHKYRDTNYIIYARGSMQYISDAYNIIEEFTNMKAKEIIFDSTPTANSEHFVVQQVKDYLFEGKMPVRIFEEDKLKSILQSKSYEICEEKVMLDMAFSHYSAWYKRLVFIFMEDKKKCI